MGEQEELRYPRPYNIGVWFQGYVVIAGELSDYKEIADVYVRAGIEGLLKEISGEFYLVIVDGDAQDGRVFCIGDHLGFVPAFLALSADPSAGLTLVVGTRLASVVAHVTAISGAVPGLLLSHLRAFLADTWHLRTGQGREASFVRGISHVLGGTYVTIYKDGRCHSRRYFRPEESYVPSGANPGSLSSALDVLEQAVRTTLHTLPSADVGVSLSGGVDSSLVAYFAREAGLRPVGIVAGLASYPSVNESESASRVASTLHIPCAVVECDNVLPFSNITPLGVLLHGPHGNMFSEQEDLLACEASRRGIPIVVDGVGGDELFGVGGTPGYLVDLMHQGALLSASQELKAWGQCLRTGPVGVLRKAVAKGWSRPEVPPWLQGLPTAAIADPVTGGTAPAILGRMRALREHVAVLDTWWNWNAIYAPKKMLNLHPLSGRRVVEASFAIAQRFVQNPRQYKWLLQRLLERTPIKGVAGGINGDYGVLVRHGARHARGKLLEWFEDSRLVRYGIATDALQEHVTRYARAATDAERDIGSPGYWMWNAILLELWMRGAEDLYGSLEIVS